ncbi:hypothetical protein Ahy_B05g075985 [Arachis hypogaea]|uniref:Pectate lyase n=1 Tax=Arachis hypogaea TaxID=3818 RepID=A0A444Z2E9_ARAHY|nr:hypothetical protein Ahy_B05g075985 [Arachis hypogaea]
MTTTTTSPTTRRNMRVTKRVTTRDWKSCQWRSIGDEFENGAFFVESGPTMAANKSFSSKDMIIAKPGSYVQRLTRFAGSFKCRVGEAC